MIVGAKLKHIKLPNK